MTEKTEAIVLNKIKYSDNAVIVNFLSRDLGRFAAIIRIPKSTKSGIKQSFLFPLSIVETEVKVKNTRTIQSLAYINRSENTDSILSDINKLTIAQFIAEVALKTIREEEPNVGVYNFLRETILNLNASNESINGLHLLFLKDFASHSGFAIQNNFCKGSPFFNLREGMFLPVFTSSEESLDIDESQVLSNLLNAKKNSDASAIHFIMRKKLIEKLLEYYRFHIPLFGEINSLKILHEVFTG